MKNVKVKLENIIRRGKKMENRRLQALAISVFVLIGGTTLAPIVASRCGGLGGELLTLLYCSSVAATTIFSLVEFLGLEEDLI